MWSFSEQCSVPVRTRLSLSGQNLHNLAVNYRTTYAEQMEENAEY